MVLHAGANIARRWSDFQSYSEADQNYFDQLLPLEGLEPSDPRKQCEVAPLLHREPQVEVKKQSEIEVEEIPLLPDDELDAIRLLQERGRIAGDLDPTRVVLLQQVPTTKAYERQAKRAALDEKIKNKVGRILRDEGLNPGHYNLGKGPDRRQNFVVLKTAIDRKVNASLGRSAGERHDFSRSEIDNIEANLDSLVNAVRQELFNGKN